MIGKGAAWTSGGCAKCLNAWRQASLRLSRRKECLRDRASPTWVLRRLIRNGRRARRRRGGVRRGQTAEQIAKICRALAAAGQLCVLVTRLDAEKAREVERLLAQADGEEAVGLAFEYRPIPKLAFTVPFPRLRAQATLPWRAPAPVTCTAPKRRPSRPRCLARAWCVCTMWA